MDSARALAWLRLSALTGEDSFSIWVLVGEYQNQSTSYIQWPKSEEVGTRFADQLLAHLESDLILKSRDKGRRSEANDGEEYALVYWGRDRAFSREWGATLFLSFFGT